MLKIIIEDLSKNQFECEIPSDTLISTIATDFSEMMGWSNKQQRVVVELVTRKGKKDKTRRLKGERSLEQERIPSGGILRIYAEAIAGSDRLERDHRNLQALKRDLAEDKAAWIKGKPPFDFTPNRPYAPDKYDLVFRMPSFVEQPRVNQKPPIGHEHKAELILPADYPKGAPEIFWKTKIFHPNIPPNVYQGKKIVCLGVLMNRYLPGLGLRRIVAMMIEIISWRNFDFYSPLNKEAAQWAYQPDNWPHIMELGGSIIQIPWKEFINPSNWGPNAPDGSLFKGIPQPPQFVQLWIQEQERLPIKFNEII